MTSCSHFQNLHKLGHRKTDGWYRFIWVFSRFRALLWNVWMNTWESLNSPTKATRLQTAIDRTGDKWGFLMGGSLHSCSILFLRVYFIAFLTKFEHYKHNLIHQTRLQRARGTVRILLFSEFSCRVLLQNVWLWNKHSKHGNVGNESPQDCSAQRQHTSTLIRKRTKLKLINYETKIT